LKLQFDANSGDFAEKVEQVNPAAMIPAVSLQKLSAGIKGGQVESEQVRYMINFGRTEPR